MQEKIDKIEKIIDLTATGALIDGTDHAIAFSFRPIALPFRQRH